MGVFGEKHTVSHTPFLHALRLHVVSSGKPVQSCGPTHSTQRPFASHSPEPPLPVQVSPTATGAFEGFPRVQISAVQSLSSLGRSELSSTAVTLPAVQKTALQSPAICTISTARTPSSAVFTQRPSKHRSVVQVAPSLHSVSSVHSGSTGSAAGAQAITIRILKAPTARTWRRLITCKKSGIEPPIRSHERHRDRAPMSTLKRHLGVAKTCELALMADGYGIAFYVRKMATSGCEIQTWLPEKTPETTRSIWWRLDTVYSMLALRVMRASGWWDEYWAFRPGYSGRIKEFNQVGTHPKRGAMNGDERSWVEIRNQPVRWRKMILCISQAAILVPALWQAHPRSL